jgi:hypothetical protein
MGDENYDSAPLGNGDQFGQPRNHRYRRLMRDWQFGQGDDLGNYGYQYVVDTSLGSIKIKISSFQGENDLDEYLEWEKKLEIIFDCHSYLEGKKVKLVIIEFTYYVIVWLDQLVLSRRRNHERLDETWEGMMAIMKRQFILSHYYKELYQKLQCLNQGTKRVVSTTRRCKS